MAVGEKVQSRHLFCRVLLVLGFIVSGVASASPFVASFSNKSDARDPAGYGKQFPVYVAAMPTKNLQRDLPVPKPVLIPVTSGAYMAKDWYVLPTFKGNPCHVPEGSLLTVSALSKSRLVGVIQWPFEYRGEGLRCADRQPPIEGGCFNGSPPKIELCTNGAVVLIDFSEALNDKGQPIEAPAVTELIKTALEK